MTGFHKQLDMKGGTCSAADARCCLVYGAPASLENTVTWG